MKFSITKNGSPLDESLYKWDEATRTLSTEENGLVLDFNTGYDCTFDTGSRCTFNTGSRCTFNTGYDCTFDTDSDCTFNTGSRCTFNTGYDCTFKTGPDCVVVRRDVFEVIMMDEKNSIRLGAMGELGYEVIEPEVKHTIVVDGEEVQLSSEGYEVVKGLIKR